MYKAFSSLAQAPANKPLLLLAAHKVGSAKDPAMGMKLLGIREFQLFRNHGSNMFARLIFEFKCRAIDGMTDPKLIELTWVIAETVAAEQQLLQKLQMNKELAARWTERERVATEQKDRSSVQKARMQEKYYERKVSELENKLTRIHGSLAPRRARVQQIEQRVHEERVRKLTRENKLSDEVARLKNLITTWRNRAQIARTQGSESMERQAIDQCAVYQRQLDKLPAQKN